MTDYEAVIGLEIHAELSTKTKLFCSCTNDPFHAPEPNLYICPVCMALPGSLPVMNRAAVEASALVGLALGCEIGWQATDTVGTKWDRKNYFYPDLPKGYQISQYDLPICHRGQLNIGDKEIAITRIHLEEDTGKLIHPAGVPYSLIDYNRAGVPLLELVTEPVIRTAAEASAFASMYQLLLRTLGIANADMEKGEMRVEANISVRPIGTQAFGTKVEVKNLNSFRSVEKAIAYETARQITAIEAGESIRQETRGWDEQKEATFVQRVKETAADYRYFPEPDLPPVTLDSTGVDVEIIKQQLPELPWERRSRYIDTYHLPEHDADRLMWDTARGDYFDRAAEAQPEQAPLIAKWIMNELPDLSVEPDNLATLASLLASGEITGKIAKELLEKMISTKKDPRVILKEEGIAVVRDTESITAWVRAVIEEQPQAAADFRAGKQESLGFLVGQLMKKSRGQVDPMQARDILTQLLMEQ